VPLVMEKASGDPGLLRTVGLTLSVIAFSVGLINFNSYLMKEHRFPYAGPLVLIHMAFISTLSSLLICVKPSLFPALTDPERRVSLDLRFFVVGALPIAALFSSSLILANLAYEHLSMAFLQMLKESGIVTTYVFSLVAGLETLSFRQCQIISIALLGASLTIKGELHFSMSGFVIQMSSQLCECARIVLQSIVLSGQKLDALSYVLLVCPICFVLLFCLMTSSVLLPAGTMGPGLTFPSLEVMKHWAPVLLLNCFVAFGLNVSIALLIKHTSAMSYIFCGVLKDVIAVIVSVVIVGEKVSHLQMVAFCIQVASVAAWSVFKSNPAAFKDGIAVGISRAVCGPSCFSNTECVLSVSGGEANKSRAEKDKPLEVEAAHNGKVV